MDNTISTNNSNFDCSYITRTIDLDANDGLSAYRGHACQQTHNVFEVFYEFLKETKPSNILEIGTALGGFTMVIKGFIDELGLQCNILTYDIHEHTWYSDMRKEGVDVRVENVFNNGYSSVDGYVIDYIQREGVTVVLCDGGSKIEEFNILSNYLKEGDYILAHDYARTVEHFNESINGKVWNWCEITQQNIESACDRNKLSLYKEDIFNNVAWTCRTKVL